MKMGKIVVLDGYAENPGDLSWKGFEQFGEVTVYDRTAREDVVARIGDAAYILTNKTVLDEAVLEQCPFVRYIGVLATGFNIVDIEAAARRGIVVTNIPGYGTDTVAQYTLALLLELCHHVGAHAESVRNGDWGRCPDFCYWNFPQVELGGKVMGIIGYGRIGKKTARLAEAFGMKVLVHSGHSVPADELSENISQASLQELFSRADVISLHCPLTEKTKGIIDKDSIAQMKDGVFLINSSRGPLICEEDLREALIHGKVAGAAVDVLSTEPPASGHPLLDAPNMLITPHIAWASKEARERLMQTAVDNMKAFLEGNPANAVMNNIDRR